MSKRKPVTLVAPNGNEHTLSDPVEVTNLLARGYVVKSVKRTVPLDKSAAPSNK